MLKKYKAKSHISLNVYPKGGSAHISFSMLTGGGSVYYTEDEEMQKAIEQHPKFGKLFKLVEQPKPAVPVKKAAPAPKGEDGKPSKKQINVACADDAKEYLVEQYGISRTKLRSIKAIKDAAEQKGIEFVGID